MTAEELRQQVKEIYDPAFLQATQDDADDPHLDAAIEVWLAARGRVRKGPTGFGFIPVSARKSRGN